MIRSDPDRRRSEIDRGVNYFILQLERLGCETEFSCEGHPGHFYIAFNADENIARRIAAAGYFDVKIITQRTIKDKVINTPHAWRMELHKKPKTKAERDKILKKAADLWDVEFGMIDWDKIQGNVKY